MQKQIIYYPRFFCLACIPSRNTSRWERFNGNYNFVSNNPIYGTIGRMLLALATTNLVLYKNNDICIGDTFKSILEKMCIKNDTKNINMLKKQLALFKNFNFEINQNLTKQHFNAVDSINNGKVKLTNDFSFFLRRRAVPICYETAHILKKNCLSFDIYVWLSHRMSYLKNSSEIQYSSLYKHFSCNHSRIRDFKVDFIHNLNKVLSIYDANITIQKDSIVLNKSNKHIT